MSYGFSVVVGSGFCLEFSLRLFIYLCWCFLVRVVLWYFRGLVVDLAGLYEEVYYCSCFSGFV